VNVQRGRSKSKETFGELVKDVRPLPSRAPRVPPPPSAPGTDRSRAPEAPAFEVRDDGTMLDGARLGFEDLLRDVRAGRLPIHDTIDLHGSSSDEAMRSLLRFLKSARGPARRLVLVVHGKGAHSPGGRGVLRDEMATWLSSPPLGEHVLCFATARAKHGGGGAVYVLVAPWR
jgi:DNA-nicking Smr family endonuclease